MHIYITAIPGLSLNPRVQNPLKSLVNLLQKGRLSRIDNLILWHDLVNNTITKHWRTNIPEETPVNFVRTLKKIKYKVSAIVYCRRFGAPDIYTLLKTTGIVIISVRKNLLSKRKQASPLIQRQYSQLHQDSILELKSLQIVLNNVNDLRFLSRNFKPKKKETISEEKEGACEKANRTTITIKE